MNALDRNLAIGISTPIERYDRHFNPLYRAISRRFPEVRLGIAVHGHGSSEDQQRHLDRLHREPCSSALPHPSVVRHGRPVALTAMGTGLRNPSLPLPVPILTENLPIAAWMRRWAEAFEADPGRGWARLAEAPRPSHGP